MSLLAQGNPFQSSDASGHKKVFSALAESSIFHSFANDFRHATGLPVSLTPAESWQLVHHGQPRENAFCALLARHSTACTACLDAQNKAAKLAAQSARTVECIHGLCETAVPVRAGDRLLGFVRTGQVFLRAPTAGGFERVLKRLARLEGKLDVARLHDAYFATRVMASAQYYSSVGLLKFLARELAMLSNQIVLQQTHNETPMIATAKRFIEANYRETITLCQVAGAAHVSPSYFSKLFKQGAGINFSCYVSRLRVEKAKHLLINPQYRVSEIGFAVGFGSLTHFNRAFKVIAGFSPTAYRARLRTRRVCLSPAEHTRLATVKPPVTDPKTRKDGGWPALAGRTPFGMPMGPTVGPWSRQFFH